MRLGGIAGAGISRRSAIKSITWFTISAHGPHAAVCAEYAADSSGDSAIFEYIEGKLVIHHNPKYTVMTNSPSFDQQLAINTYWKGVNGLSFQPGTIGSADRFVRMSWSLNAAPKEKGPKLAVATAFSLIRSISVPLGLADPDKPNIAATI